MYLLLEQIEGRCSLSTLCKLLSCVEAREMVFSRPPQVVLTDQRLVLSRIPCALLPFVDDGSL